MSEVESYVYDGFDMDKDHLVNFLHELAIALDNGEAYAQGLNESVSGDIDEDITREVTITFLQKSGSTIPHAVQTEPPLGEVDDDS